MQSWFFFVLAAAIFGSIAMLFKKKALVKEHTSEYLVAFKPLELLLLLLFLPLITFKVSFHLLAFTFLVSILTSITLVFISSCFRHMNLSIVAPMFNVLPVFLLVLAFFLLGEQLSAKHLLGVGLILAGTYFLEAEHRSGGWLSPLKKLKSKYMILLFFGFILSAIVTISHKVLLGSMQPFTLLFYLYGFQSLNFFVFSSFVYGGWRDIVHAYKNAWRDLLGNAFFSNLSNLAYFFAISLTFVSLAAPVKRLSSLFAIFLSGRFLHEGRIWHKSLACVIMLAGVFVIAL